VRRPILIMLLLCIPALGNCSSKAGNEECIKMADDLDKSYDAIATEQSPDPQRVFKQFNDLSKKAESAASSCPDSIRIYSVLSSVYMGLGRNKDAFACAQKAISINPESWEANSLMGSALSVLDRFSESLPYLEKAAKLAPDKVFLLMNLCSTYDMAKQYEKAVETCSLVIKNDDKKFLGEALYVRGRVYRSMGKKKESEKDFQAAKTLGVDLSEYYTPEHLGKTP
jgi:tetratricopeptide (TPR) repeat protein